ncbi:chaperonin 10-like protein [Cyathus striatus]|nr:chaperonin 10-like protein [Cyathus striatus]
MSTHTAIATTSLGQFDLVQVPTETPGEGEVLIKVEYAAMIAFDTYQNDRGLFVEKYPHIFGFDAAGTIAKVGSGVPDLKVGDRVTSFAFGASRNKAMQQYVVQPYTVVGKVPDNMSLAAAASVPDNFVTAFYTLFNQLELPLPSSWPATEAPPLAATPILVYGGGSSAGQYATQLLHLAGYKNIIVIASSGHFDYLRSLGATHTFDYNSLTLAEDVSAAIGGEGKITLGVDAITAVGTVKIISKIFSPTGKLAILLPVKEGSTVTGSLEEKMHSEIPEDSNPFPKTTSIVPVRTFLYQNDPVLKEKLMPKVLPELLASGAIEPNRVRLLDQGSLKDRVGLGLDLLRNNKIRGEKVVVKVEA